MPTMTYQVRARAELLDELTAALGVPATDLVVSPGDEQTTITFPDEIDPALVDAVVAAHDPAAIDAAASQKRQALRDAAATLKQHYARATSTNAQNTEAVKALSLLMREVVAELRED